ncbi:MAG: hypothetical protein AAB676_15345 [Verrucomicrobiota bacterium]
MSTVEEIKAAAASLKPEERFALYQWLYDSEELRRLRLAELKRDIAIGIEEADRGEVAPLDIEAIKAEGRRRLEVKPKT